MNNFDWNTAYIIGSFLFGGFGFVFAVKADVKVIDNRLKSVETTLAEVGKALVTIARQEVIVDGLSKRLDSVQSSGHRWNGHT